MTILNEFVHISGLGINVEKTKMIKIEAWRDSMVKLCYDLDLIWTDEFTSVGITYNVMEMIKITKLNIDQTSLNISVESKTNGT